MEIYMWDGFLFWEMEKSFFLRFCFWGLGFVVLSMLGVAQG